MLTTISPRLNLKVPIYNASGPWCTTEDELIALAKSPSTGAIVSKSCTLKPREGNPHPRYYQTSELTTNSTGLANQGYLFYSNHGLISKLKSSAPFEKPYLISVAGLTQEANLTIIRHLCAIETPPDGIELNLSCPNIPGKPQTGYDLVATEDILRQVASIYQDADRNPTVLPDLGLKMPPYFDQAQIAEMADLINQFSPLVSFITCINSLGNGLIIDPETDQPVIKAKGGLGGIGGQVIKPFALSNVYNFRKNLTTNIKIVGCGGITNGMDAYQHLLVGASVVQVGSEFMRKGVSCFDRILEELMEVIQQRGHTQLSDFCCTYQPN